VLPAPFGPIRAVMTPRWISMCWTSTALRPPNVRVMSSPTTIGSGLATPGSLGSAASASRALVMSTGIERDLLPVADDPLGSVDHQQHEAEPHEDVADEAGLRVGHDRGR